MHCSWRVQGEIITQRAESVKAAAQRDYAQVESTIRNTGITEEKQVLYAKARYGKVARV